VDGLMLLRQARQAGLRVGADGDRLVVEGPRRLESMARTLLAEKPEVLRALAREGTEVGWRVQVMRPQVPAKGAIPLLVARPGGPWDQGRCCSCGDALEADERYRCGPCVAATVAVLETVA
jgi:hypothetical protein